MITAAEAREKTIPKEVFVAENLERIEKLINEACHNGEFSIEVEDLKFPNNTAKELKRLGYMVHLSEYDTICNISWERPLGGNRSNGVD